MAPPETSSLTQACAAAALHHSSARASEASKAASLAREAAEEAERSLMQRVKALVDDKACSPCLRVDIGSGVLARATPVRYKTVILPVGLGFYLESGGGSNRTNDDDNKNENDTSKKNEEALFLAESRVAALKERAQRAALKAARAREEAERDARLAVSR